jgi:PAS domain S-box-containing protein
MRAGASRRLRHADEFPQVATSEPGTRGDAQANAAPDFLHQGFEWLPIGVVLVDTIGAIVLVNREAERLFGYARPELIGRSVDELLPDATRVEHARLRDEYLQRPEARPLGAGRELLARRKDGAEVPVEIGLTPIQIGDREFVLASIVDISERRRIQHELRARRDERLELEGLVSELGAELCHLRPEDVDRALVESLGRVVRALGLDRGAIVQFADDTGDVLYTHQWTRPGWESQPARVPARESFPWHFAHVTSGELVSFATLDDVPHATDREGLRRMEIAAGVTVPVIRDGTTWGAVTFSSSRSYAWTADVINRLRVVALLFANVIARKHGDEALRRTVTECAGIHERLRHENAYLRQELRTLTGASTIVGHSPAIRQIVEQVRHVAATGSSVLLLGETGTGKTLLASRIHELSARRDRALVRVNCASLSAASIETELFGSERGLYADPDERHVGRLELGSRSTVFLDEVADLPLDAQASLVHALQERHIQPLGSARPVKVDLRIVASSRRDLPRCVADGTLRDDLYQLLNVVPIYVPPLRERPEDLPPLVWHFVDELSDAYGKPIDTIDKDAMAAMQRYSWPGNAREVRTVVERAVLVATGRHLGLPLGVGAATPRRSETLAAVEREHIAAIVAACGGRLTGKDGAAARLGITPRALQVKMTEHGIHRSGMIATRSDERRPRATAGRESS